MSFDHDFDYGEGNYFSDYDRNSEISSGIDSEDFSEYGVQELRLPACQCEQAKSSVLSHKDYSREGRLSKHIGGLHDGSVDSSLSVDISEDDKLADSQKTIYSEPFMREYGLVRSLLIRAQMKGGKTKGLRQFVNKYFPAVPHVKPAVIQFVTFRQTFIESLHRLSITDEPINLLIIDESESTLAQFSSGLHKHFTSSFAAFQSMMHSAKHLICMDANLGNRTYYSVQRMRRFPPHLHWNQYLWAKEDLFYFTTQIGDWLASLLKAVENSQKIVIPVNVLKDAKLIEHHIRNKFPNKKIGLYSSETLPSTKKEHFNDVDSYWGDLDVLIYTPTVSAGVSYELERFDSVFACFSDNLCNVETCRQMLARVHNIRSHQYFICFRLINECHDLLVTTDSISQLLHDKRSGLYQQITDFALHFEHMVDGNILFYKSNYFYLWLETERLKNLSKNNFMLRFVDQIHYTGAQVNLLPTNGREDITASNKVYRDIKAQLENEHCEAVAGAPDIGRDTALDIWEKMNNEEDVPLTDRLSVKKFNLRGFYYLDEDEKINGDFVKKYSKPAVKSVYDNLEVITHEHSLDNALQKLRGQEYTKYHDILGVYDYDDENHSPPNYTEGRDLMNERKSYITLASNIRNMLSAIKKHLDKFIYEFEVSPLSTRSYGKCMVYRFKNPGEKTVQINIPSLEIRSSSSDTSSTSS
ncbi:hypothetical protein C1645_828222 [Glomus cerebriforme]|uniref:Replication origin-binding protein domain-containing protein n=1 Tax=Glomus cerebriforme TaxID=658196 RepID=A0A397SW51_9GLOM|nr:hypothetical protein C1645_828222 [Glomus cerebriforme]